MNKRFEIVVAALLVGAGAFFVRAEYIPPEAEKHVEVAASRYELDLGEPNRWFAAWSIGDGQAFAVIAADPSGMKLSTEIKEPHYRFSRAGYGWLSYFGSLGQERFIPYGMALIGGLAVLGNLILAVSLRSRLGQEVWILVVNPALYIGFAGDTAEPLALLLLTFAIASEARWASIALGLTRPSYVVALLMKPRLALLGLTSAAVLLTYGIVRFGTEQLIPSGGRVGLPFAAYVEHPSVAGWVLAAFALVTLVIGVRKRNWAWIVSGLLVISLGSDVTLNIENAWRAAGMLPILWAFGPSRRSSRPDETVVAETQIGSR